jgi:hypothetical protein
LIEVSPDGIDKWWFDRHLTATVVYNHLSTGNLIKDTGPSEGIG